MAGSRERPPLPVRRLGYAVAAAINLVLLYVVLAVDWRELSFLTADTERVLWLLQVSLLANAAANVLFVVHDPVPVKAGVDIATDALSLVLMVRIWQVFPFDLSATWDLVARTALFFGVVGCAIAILTTGITLARAVQHDEEPVSSSR